MNLETIALLAELRYKILEAAVMVNNGYSEKEIVNHLIKTANSINHTYQITRE